MKSQTEYMLLFIVISVTFAYDDLSKSKTAVQNSMRACLYNCSGGVAVDGDISTCMETMDIGGSSTYDNMWWLVDLGDTYSIYSIRIAFRTFGDQYAERQRGRVAGFSLYLSNSTSKENGWRCYKDGPQLPPLNFSTNCIGYGRFVIYYNERIKGITYPEGYQSQSYNFLCEVIVKGCEKKGFYGSDCNTPCPENCHHQRCFIVNGSCLECNPGWTGHTCEKKCSEGLFGIDCKNKCVGHCFQGDTCNHVSGYCDSGCASGWTGSKCDKLCEDGMFGINCSYSCSGHCLKNSYCNKISGHCDTGCDPGHIGSFCNKTCSPGKFGNLCKENCSGHCVNNMKCNNVDGVCTEGCSDGYTEAKCNKPCEADFFGKKCSQRCSVNCVIASECKNTDGACKCAPGWTGSPDCNKECYQSYGENCQTPCSEYCVNSTCDRFNGSCLAGCKGGATGGKCDQGVVTSSTHSVDTLTIVGVVMVTVVIILAAVVILFIRRKILQIFKTNKKFPGSNATQNIQVVSEYMNDYQELTTSRDKNEYQSIQLSGVSSLEPINTNMYQNFVLTTH